MTLAEQIQIVEDNLKEYGVCDITIEEFNYLKDELYSSGCLSGIELGRADTIDEYNGYRRKIIDITTTEDFGQLKRVATVDISENLIKELSQEELLRVILDEIAEQMQEGAE